MPWKMWMPLAGMMLASGCVLEVQSRSDSRTFSEPIVGVVADVGAGDLSVIGTAIDGAEVFQALEWTGAEPRLTTEVVDQVLYVTVECRSGLRVCRVDSELIVPEGAWLSLGTGAGDVDIKGTAADIDAETGAGDISLTDVAGAVIVETGSGEVYGRDLAATALQINTGSGDVDVASDRAPAEVDISTGSGDVALAVPSGAYAVDVSTGAGDVTVSGITEQDRADRWIEIDTGSGDVAIRGR